MPPQSASKSNGNGIPTPIPILAPVLRPGGLLVGAFIAVVEDFGPKDDDTLVLAWPLRIGSVWEGLNAKRETVSVSRTR